MTSRRHSRTDTPFLALFRRAPPSASSFLVKIFSSPTGRIPRIANGGAVALRVKSTRRCNGRASCSRTSLSSKRDHTELRRYRGLSKGEREKFISYIHRREKRKNFYSPSVPPSRLYILINDIGNFFSFPLLLRLNGSLRKK